METINSTPQKQTLLQRVRKNFKINPDYFLIASELIALLLMFVGLFDEIVGINIESYGLTSTNFVASAFVLSILNSVLIVYFKYKKNKRNGIIFGLIQNIFFTYIFLYFVRLNESSINIGGADVDFYTSFALIAVFYSTFLWYIIKKGFLPAIHRGILVFFGVLSTFSFFTFVNEEIASGRIFVNQFLDNFFRYFNQIPWLLLLAIFISLSTTTIIQNYFRKDIFLERTLIFVTFALIMFQLLIFIHAMSLSGFAIDRLTYWYLAIAIFIIYDFFQKPFALLLNGEEFEFNRKLTAFSLYHAILLFVVLYHDPVFNLVSLFVN